MRENAIIHSRLRGLKLRGWVYGKIEKKTRSLRPNSTHKNFSYIWHVDGEISADLEMPCTLTTDSMPAIDYMGNIQFSRIVVVRAFRVVFAYATIYRCMHAFIIAICLYYLFLIIIWTEELLTFVLFIIFSLILTMHVYI